MTATLAEAINTAAPADHLVFLLNERGAPVTAKGFGKWLSAQCDRIGLNGLSPHGVRKLAATRMADRQATAHELMAFFGWASIKEAEHYTRKADRERLARSAVARTEQQPEWQTRWPKVANRARKPDETGISRCLGKIGSILPVCVLASMLADLGRLVRYCELRGPK